MSPLLLLIAIGGVAYAISKMDKSSSVPGAKTDASLPWGLLPPRQPPADVFYLDVTTKPPSFAYSPLRDLDALPNGSVVTAVMQGLTKGAANSLPLVVGKFTVIENATGEHNPWGITNIDPKGWYYTLRLDAILNPDGLKVVPPIGYVLRAMPAGLIGKVVSIQLN